LAERGVLDYSAPLAHYWPEFAVRGKDRATVGDALTHRVGIPQDPPGFHLSDAGDWDAVCAATAGLEPLWSPGTRTDYHPLTYGWMLGEVLRRVEGRPIDRFLQEEICRPLGIEDIYFGVPEELDSRVATLRFDPGPSSLDLSANPSLSDPASLFNRSAIRRCVIPGAGAILNARSLARLYAMLANGGILDGVRLLSPERIALTSKPQPENTEGARAHWWFAHGLGYTLGGGPGPRLNRPRAFGYEGIGTIGFADPERRFAFAFLKNRLDLSSREMNAAVVVTQAVEEALGIAE
jgi:CubicO group peptidase (beta-lactamase class C family)